MSANQKAAIRNFNKHLCYEPILNVTESSGLWRTIFSHSGRSDLLSLCLSQLLLSLKVRPGYFQLKLKKSSSATGSMESGDWEETGADAALFGTLQEGSLVGTRLSFLTEFSGT